MQALKQLITHRVVRVQWHMSVENNMDQIRRMQGEVAGLMRLLKDIDNDDPMMTAQAQEK